MLTVVFATHNGAETLPTMLRAFCDLQSPVGGWHLLAVNNASTDGTMQVLEDFRHKLPLSVIDCSERGKNRALNRALSELTGDLVVFTDDDVIPRTDWLVQVRRAAEENPSFDIFGGEITPSWEVEPPAWLLEGIEIGAAYAITRSGQTSGAVTASLVWGANMAVRSFIFTELGHRFDESVGPGLGQYIMGSETSLTTGLESLGHHCYFNAEASVGHMIPAEYLERAWLRGRAFRAGRGYWVRWRCDEDYCGPRWFGAPRYLYGQQLRLWLQRLTQCLAGNKAACLKADWDMHKTRGMIAQARQYSAG